MPVQFDDADENRPTQRAGTGSGTNIVGADGSSTTGIPESFRAAENSATKNTAHNRAGSDGKGKEPGQGLVYGDLNDLWLLRPVMAAGPGTKFQDRCQRYPQLTCIAGVAHRPTCCFISCGAQHMMVYIHPDFCLAVPVGTLTSGRCLVVPEEPMHLVAIHHSQR